MRQPALKGGEVGGEGEISAEHFVWLLGGLARFYRLPFDAALLLQQFPPPYALHTLLEAARALGFKAGQSTIHEGKMGDVPLPAIGFLRAAAGGSDDGAAAGRVPALILRCDGERFLYVAAGSEVPNARRLADFEALFEPAVVLVAHEAPADEQVRGFEDERRKFGFRWFVPELARHKTIWRDVLMASAAIQLIGLATPLFTQVIVDKVVVHHTQSTLIAVAVALAMFLVFNAVMTGMRQTTAPYGTRHRSARASGAG